MKQTVSLILVLCMLIFALASCGTSSTPSKTQTSHTHSFGNWTITKDATCTESGRKERVCSCGEKETQAIAALGHNWSNATCQKPKTCLRCGSTEGSTTSHSTRQGYCSICGNFINDLHDQALVFGTCVDEMSSANVSANFAYERGDLATAIQYLNVFADNISEMFKMYSQYPTDFDVMYDVINDLYNSYVDYIDSFNSKTTNSEKLKCVNAMIQTYTNWRLDVFRPAWETIWKYE